MIRFWKIGIWGLFVIWILLFGISAYADSVNGYTWSSNIGWIKMSGPGYGVEYNKATGLFSGWAWSSNIGWISFDGNWAQVQSGLDTGAGGWDGRIRLNGPDFGISYIQDSQRGCYLSGWAWGSDVVGWVQFTGNTFTTRISPCELEVEDPKPGDVSCSFGAVPERLIRPRNETTLSWSCQSANQCSITDIGSVNPDSGSATAIADVTKTFTLSCSNDASSFSSSVEIKVFQPTYCEIIPHGPGCE